MAAEWYYSKGNQQQGPVSASELKQMAQSGHLAPGDLVWNEGMKDWKPASTISCLVLVPTSSVSSSGDWITPSDPPKDPILIAFLSFLFPGLWLGQIVVGQAAKGIVMIFVAPLLFAALAGVLIYIDALPKLGLDLDPLMQFTILLPAFGVVVPIDAYLVARSLKAGRPVGKWQFFPGL